MICDGCLNELGRYGINLNFEIEYDYKCSKSDCYYILNTGAKHCTYFEQKEKEEI